MQMVKKVFLVFVLVWFAFLMFMPKVEFYYVLEEKLAEKGIRLNEGSIEEGLFTLTLHDVTLYAKGIELAQVKELQFFTLLFYTSLTLEALEVDEVLYTKMPAKTDEASVTHNILMPTVFSVDANGTAGSIEGEINLLENSVRLAFMQSQETSMLKPLLKKDEKGWYYEGSF